MSNSWRAMLPLPVATQESEEDRLLHEPERKAGLQLVFIPEGQDYRCISAAGEPRPGSSSIHGCFAGKLLGELLESADERGMFRHLLGLSLQGFPQQLELNDLQGVTRLSFRSTALAGNPMAMEAHVTIEVFKQQANHTTLNYLEEATAVEIFSSMPVGVVIVNDRMELQLVNQAACRCLRVTESQLRGTAPLPKDWHLTFSNGQRIDFGSNELTEVMRRGETFQDRLIAVWNSDTRLYSWIMASGKPTCRNNGDKLFLLMIHDVTELMQSKERYQTITQHSLDAICVTDGEHWVYSNQTGLELFEAASEEEFIGRNAFAMLDPRYHEECRERIRLVLEENRVTPLHEEEWVTLKGSRRICEVLGVPIVLDNRRLIKLFIRDITDRKRSHDLLLQSEKLNVAGQIAASVAHEIRNPLTSLKGFIKLIRQQGGESRYLSIMDTELQRINSIAQELLYLGKPQVGDYRPQSMGSVVEQVVSLMESQAHMCNVFLHMTANEDMIVQGDENQLKQMFINLIKNAVEAMPEGGTVTVSSTREDRFAVIRIRDNGCGIPKELIDKLGDPFFTTKKSGTGLGLMVCRNIIREHQGRMDVMSEPGTGTLFTLRLPLHGSQEEAC